MEKLLILFMNDPLWFTLADGPCSGLGSKTVLSKNGLCFALSENLLNMVVKREGGVKKC